MSKLISWLVGFFLLFLVYIAALWSRAQPIETDITRRTEAALKQQGHNWAKVVVDGRDVTIKSAADFPDETAASNALSVAEDIRGARIVRDLVERQTPSVEQPIEVVSTTKEPQKPEPEVIEAPKESAEPEPPKVIDQPVLEIAKEPEPVQKPESVQEPIEEPVTVAKVEPKEDQTKKVVAEEVVDNTPLSPEECQKLFDRTLKDKIVQFSTGSSAIRKSSHKLLNTIASTAARCPDKRVEVGGHTDNTGTRDANIRLSRLRAESVITYLIKRGIDPNRLVAKGYGSSNPVWSNATDEGKARNRRIEFKIRD